MPFYAVIMPFRGFVSLHVLNLGFLIGGKFVIAVFDRYHSLIPKLL